jgi:hypothetical protein
VIRVNESVAEAEELTVETVTVIITGELTADEGGEPVKECASESNLSHSGRPAAA